jgi:hypothetical protein
MIRVLYVCLYRLCGLVVRVPGYRSRGPGFNSRPYQIFWEVVGLERGPLSLVSTTEELLEWKSSGSGLENREYGRGDPSRWPRDTLYPQNLALTSPKSGVRSVGIVRLRTKTTEFLCSSETSVDFHLKTQQCILENRTFRAHRCENLKSNSMHVYSKFSEQKWPSTSQGSNSVRRMDTGLYVCCIVLPSADKGPCDKLTYQRRRGARGTVVGWGTML